MKGFGLFGRAMLLLAVLPLNAVAETVWFSVEVQQGKRISVDDIEPVGFELSEQERESMKATLPGMLSAFSYDGEAVPIQISVRGDAIKEDNGSWFLNHAFFEPRSVSRTSIPESIAESFDGWFYAFFEFVLGANGEPAEIHLLNRERFTDAQAKQLTALFSEWRFKPVRVDGRPAPILQRYAWYRLPDRLAASGSPPYEATFVHTIDAGGLSIDIDVHTDGFPREETQLFVNRMRGNNLADFYPAGEEYGRIVKLSQRTLYPAPPQSVSVSYDFANGYPPEGRISARLAFTPSGRTEVIGLIPKYLPLEMHPFIERKIAALGVKSELNSATSAYTETTVEFHYLIPDEDNPESMQLTELRRAPFLYEDSFEKGFVRFLEDCESLTARYELRMTPHGYPSRVKILNAEEFDDDFLAYLQEAGYRLAFATKLVNGRPKPRTYQIPIVMTPPSGECPP